MQSHLRQDNETLIEYRGAGTVYLGRWDVFLQMCSNSFGRTMSGTNARRADEGRQPTSAD
jgi:hypothetical protein